SFGSTYCCFGKSRHNHLTEQYCSSQNPSNCSKSSLCRRNIRDKYFLPQTVASELVTQFKIRKIDTDNSSYFSDTKKLLRTIWNKDITYPPHRLNITRTGWILFHQTTQTGHLNINRAFHRAPF